MDVPPELDGFVPRYDKLFLNLRKVPPAALTGSALACALRVLQVEDASLADLESALTEALGGLEAFAEPDYAQWWRAMWYLVLLVRHRRPVHEQKVLYGLMDQTVRAHREEVEQMMVTGADALIEEGRRQGL